MSNKYSNAPVILPNGVGAWVDQIKKYQNEYENGSSALIDFQNETPETVDDWADALDGGQTEAKQKLIEAFFFGWLADDAKEPEPEPEKKFYLVAADHDGHTFVDHMNHDGSREYLKKPDGACDEYTFVELYPVQSEPREVPNVSWSPIVFTASEVEELFNVNPILEKLVKPVEVNK